MLWMMRSGPPKVREVVAIVPGFAEQLVPPSVFLFCGLQKQKTPRAVKHPEGLSIVRFERRGVGGMGIPLKST